MISISTIGATSTALGRPIKKQAIKSLNVCTLYMFSRVVFIISNYLGLVAVINGVIIAFLSRTCNYLKYHSALHTSLLKKTANLL